MNRESDIVEHEEIAEFREAPQTEDGLPRIGDGSGLCPVEVAGVRRQLEPMDIEIADGYRKTSAQFMRYLKAGLLSIGSAECAVLAVSEPWIDDATTRYRRGGSLSG